jgi:hypothetical protein
MSSARFISPSANVGGRSVSQNLEEIIRLPFKGVQDEKGVDGARAKGSSASLAQEARDKASAKRAMIRTDDTPVPLLSGIYEGGVF